MWEKDGLLVEADYNNLVVPITYKDYMDTILQLQGEKYASFNKVGRGNTGYLFRVSTKLAKFFFEIIGNKNGDINQQILIERRITVLQLFRKLFDKSRFNHLFLNSNASVQDVNMRFEAIDASNFDPESFPLKDFEVEYDYHTNQSLIKVEKDIVDSSKFKFVLKDKINSHDISLDLFIDIFGDFKKTLKELADNVCSNVLNQVAFQLLDVKINSLQPSSFGVWLKLENDLLEFESVTLEYFFQLLEDISFKDKRDLQESILFDEYYSLNTIKNVRSLLNHISDNELSLQIEGTTRNNNDTRIVKFDKELYSKVSILGDILKDNSISSKENIVVEGILTSINTSNNNLRITTTDSGDISGKLSKELFHKLKKDNELQFLVPRFIKAKLIKETINDLVEDVSSVKYTLTEFEQDE